MKIPVKHVEKMEEIIVDMKKGYTKCQKDFRCYSSSLEELCLVKGIGAFDTIECVAEDSSCCGFSFVAVDTRYCKCPLRRYIAANFRK